MLTWLTHMSIYSSLPNLETQVKSENSLKNILVSNENSMEMMPDISDDNYDTLSQLQENANSMTTDSIPEPQSFE